jgi:hypothetical protein
MFRHSTKAAILVSHVRALFVFCLSSTRWSSVCCARHHQRHLGQQTLPGQNHNHGGKCGMEIGIHIERIKQFNE